VKLQIFNDHEKAIAKKTVDVRSQIDDQDEEVSNRILLLPST
jgi:hypothetical protein